MLYLLYNIRGVPGKAFLNEINYIQSEGRKLFIHKADGIIEYYEYMKDVLPRLDYRFYKCHRSLIINLSKIDFFSKNEVFFFNGDSVHIGIHNLRLTKNGYKAFIEKSASKLLGDVRIISR